MVKREGCISEKEMWYCDTCTYKEKPNTCKAVREDEGFIRFIEEGGVKKPIGGGEIDDSWLKEREEELIKEKEEELRRKEEENQRRLKEMEDYEEQRMKQEREREERRKKQEREERNAKIKILATLVLCPLLCGIIIVSGVMGPGYTFQYKVHGHMENAYYADTPDLMIAELEKAKQGMKDLGLEEDMYGAFWPWGKTPDMRMDYQYKHIDAIIDRAWAVQEWINITYGENATTTEYLGDVYEQKMKNVRKFIQDEGWSDDIAHEAYFVNYHIFYYFLPWWIGIIILLSIIYVIKQISVLDGF